MLQKELARILAREGQRARQQFLVNNRQAVLIAVTANAPLKRFRRRVDRSHTGRTPESAGAVAGDQTEIGNLYVLAYQEQVMRLSQKLASFTKGDADVLRSQ